MHAVPHSARLRKVILPALLVAGDTLVAFGALSLGYWLRYETPIGSVGLEVPNATYVQYLPLLLLGTAFLIAAYAQLGLYEERLLLRKFQSLNLVIRGTTFWLIAYLSLSLVLKFYPPISSSRRCSLGAAPSTPCLRIPAGLASSASAWRSSVGIKRPAPSPPISPPARPTRLLSPVSFPCPTIQSPPPTSP